MMALTGNEVIYTEGLQPNGQPSGVPTLVKAADVAAVLTKNRGAVTLNGAAPVAVAFAGMTASTTILFSLNTPEGTVGAHPVVETVTPGIGFTVAGTAGDTSVYNWVGIGI